jgi:hypothetical protein
MPRSKNPKSPWDQRLSNDGAMADQCMKLGAVILKPASKPPVGFSAPPTVPEEPDE